MNTSVLPHQTSTRRSSWFVRLNSRMSATTCSASSCLFAPFFTLGPLSRLTYRWSKTADHGRIDSSSGLICARSGGSSTPAVRAAS